MRLTSFLLLVLVAAPVAAGPEIREAWVRAVPPVAKSTAAYFVLANPGAEPLVLQGARADFARHAMMHDMAGEKGARRMVHLDEVTVPAGGEVRFEPGGRHLMLTGLERVPAEGETVEVCLVLSSGEICHAFPVRRDRGN